MAQQPHRVAASTQQADIDLGQAEGGLLGGDEHVAGCGERQAGTERGAVQGGDDRLGAFTYRMKAFPCSPRVLGQGARR